MGPRLRMTNMHLNPLILRVRRRCLGSLRAVVLAASVALTYHTFALTGSKTGPDGEGRSDARFVSRSGRVVIAPEDWNVAYALMLGGIQPAPELFEVKWKVEPHFVDEFRSPAGQDAATEATVTLAQGLPNTRHTLEITGSDATFVRAFRVYQPPLGRRAPR